MRRTDILAAMVQENAQSAPRVVYGRKREKESGREEGSVNMVEVGVERWLRQGLLISNTTYRWQRQERQNPD